MTAALTADFKTEPFLHQLREFELSADMPSRALIWQMRTGKSKLMVDTACHLYAVSRDIDAVLVFAPNGVHENWARRELPIHHWDNVPYSTFVWRTDLKDDEGFNAGFAHALKDRTRLRWFCFASDTMTRADVRKFVKRVVNRRRCLVIFDESQDYRTPGSKRTSMARALAKKCPYRRILSGTPLDNSPLHAFTQFELLEEGALGYDTYGDFKAHFAVYEQKTTRGGKTYPALKEYRHLDELRDAMAPWTSVVLREDCHDLPALVRSRRAVTLTEEQLRIYRELHRSFEVEVNGELVSIGEASARFIKLQQVVSGYLRDEFGDTHWIHPPEENPRVQTLLDEVRMTTGRVVVWCQFRHDLDLVAAAMRAAGRDVLEYHGRVSAADKARARELMAPGTGDEGPDLVGQAQSGGAGLDFSSANKIIWYSHTFDAIVRGQADERATAMGGGNVPVVDLVAPGIDEYVLDDVLENKWSLADDLSRRGLKEAIERTRI